MLQVVNNTFSKWLEVILTTNANSMSRIRALKHCFTTHSCSQQIRSDSRSVLNHNDFKLFAKSQGIKHIKSASYHASTNGCSKRGVGTFKVTMKKLADIKPMPENLQMFLFQYDITPQSATGKYPKELLNRKLNIMLNIIKLDADSRKVSYPGNIPNV